MLDPIYEDYLSIDAVFDSIAACGQNETFGWCLSLATVLHNVAFMSDMLWEYDSGSYQTELCAKLDLLASYTDSLLAYSRTFSPEGDLGAGYPYMKSNGRIRLAAALGYAGIILNNSSYVNHAIYDLFQWQHPAASITNPGSLGLYVTSSGVYGEGMAYTTYIFDVLNTFFLAYKRYSGLNLFEHQYVKSILENSLNCLGPDFNPLSIDDSVFGSRIHYENGCVTNISYQPKSFFAMIPYFYQTDEADNKIRWYLNEYRDKAPYWNGNHYCRALILYPCCRITKIRT